MSLTPNQARFVEEYLKDLNATQAAIRAGYSEKGAEVRGSELLRNRKVADAIAEAKSERSERTKIDADWVLRQLVQNVNRASTAEPVLDSKGMETGEYVYQGAVVNQALKLIGDHIGFFPDGKTKVILEGEVRHEHTGTVTIAGRIAEFTDAFTRATDREEEGGVSGDGPRKPVDS